MPTRRLGLTITSVAALAGALLLGLERPRSGRSELLPARPPSQERHYVTPRQLTATGVLAGMPVALGTATDHLGKTVLWSDLTADRPLVVVFIKDGCPCNVEFEPFFHRLIAIYDGLVR